MIFQTREQKKGAHCQFITNGLPSNLQNLFGRTRKGNQPKKGVYET